MNTKVVPAVLTCVFLCALFAASAVFAQSNVVVRIMAANLTGNSQTYGDTQIRIFQGLKPDIICIQEFKYGGNSDADIRAFVNTAFGPTFQYTRETNASYDIPNGIISRYPIVAAGSWDDSESPNRGFAWARIDVPGTNDLLAVSVHLLTSDSATRGMEAAELRAILQTNINVPPGGWIVVGGDFNTDTRSESAINTLTNGNFLRDTPIPTDAGGDPDTNLNRNKPYDYVLPSTPFASRLTNVVIAASSFPNGLVFDSRVYANLADVSPVQLNDSANGQHMAVIKDFLIQSGNETNPPVIIDQPLSQTNSAGANVTFTATATGTDPLSYQWRHTTTNVPGATASSLMLTNIQTADAGVYAVVITNLAGSVTSSNALLVITTTPVITNQPQNQTVMVGETAGFNVGVTGPGPLGYQWRFSGTNLPGSIANSFTRTNVQLTDAGNYSVVITNASGSITSDVAVLTVDAPIVGGIVAQWDFNSVPSDGSTTSGTTAPSVGSGTASLVTALTPTFAGGSGTDPEVANNNSAWNTTGYPSATSGNKTAGVRFDISTVGMQNLVVRWDQRVSNTGSKYSRLQYTTNGSNFLDFPTSVGVVAATTFEAHTNNLSSLPGVNNNPQFAFRIVNEFESTATGSGMNAYVPAQTISGYAGSGTTRFDMVTLLGSTFTTNALPYPPVLTNLTRVAEHLHFDVVGSVGSNYIVQGTTNLTNPNWLSLRTNAAPFSFAEPDVFVFPQRFYRAVAAP